jgi:lysophospholipase L1-like esterase
MRLKALLALAAVFAAASASLSISQAPAGRSSLRADCSLTSTGLIPLTDMGNRRYRGYRGGLYPGGVNRPAPKYLRKGLAASRQVRPINGKIVLLSIGMSNATAEFSAFKRSSDRDPDVNPKLVVVDGAQDGFDATTVIAKPVYWDNVDARLKAAGVSAAQVEVVWLKEAIAGEHRRFPKDAKALQNNLRQIIRTMRLRYPKLRLVYVSSRTYGGYAVTGLNPEPAAYDSGYAVRGVIQDRVSGKLKGPWVAWGPYLWTDGLTGRNDGLTWTCDDVEADGTHPSKAGVQKVVNLLTTFFKTDPTAKRWYLAPRARS